MTSHHDQPDQAVEAMLARYRPAEAPRALLDRVELAAGRSCTRRPNRLRDGLSMAAELLLGLLVRGVVTATAAAALLLIALKGY